MKRGEPPKWSYCKEGGTFGGCLLPSNASITSTLCLPLRHPCPYSRLLLSSDSKTLPIYGQFPPPMQLLSIRLTSSVTSGQNRNYAGFNGGQFAQIILARINRLDRDFRGSVTHFIRRLRKPAAKGDVSPTSRVLVHKKDTEYASGNNPMVTY